MCEQTTIISTSVTYLSRKKKNKHKEGVSMKIGMKGDAREQTRAGEVATGKMRRRYTCIACWK